jgi:hypothetical protein
MRDDGKWRLDYCEVVLSDWLMRAIEANEVVTSRKTTSAFAALGAPPL